MMSTPVTDSAQTSCQDVSLAKYGDKKAFERLILQYNDSIYRIAYSMLGNKQDIEDAYQNTIIKCYKGIARLKNDEFFKTWLIRVLINECNNILKHRKKVVSLEKIDDTTVISDDYSKLELTVAVNNLEAKLKIVTILYYFEDISQKRISEILSIPEGTVASRLSRARIKLFESLKEI